MPIVAFTFGAFGDIFSLIQLAISVRKALSESTGASMEYQDLVMDLDSFIQIVNCVHRTMSSPGPDRLSPSIENALNASLATCTMLIGRIQVNIVQYRQSLRKGGSNRMMLDSWRKIGWSLFARNEVTDLRHRLSEQVEVINTMLTLAQTRLLARGQHEMMRQQCTIIRELHRSAVQRPKLIGHTWEGDPAPGHKPYLLTDLCGHSLLVPFEFFADTSRFARFLGFYLENRPGRAFMYRNRSFYTVKYNTEDTHRNSDWAVQPAAHVELWAWAFIRARYVKACPSCFKDYPIPQMIRDNFTGICPFCQTVFHIQPYWYFDRGDCDTPLPKGLKRLGAYLSTPSKGMLAGPRPVREEDEIRLQPFLRNAIGPLFLEQYGYDWDVAEEDESRFIRKFSVTPYLPSFVPSKFYTGYGKPDPPFISEMNLRALVELKGYRFDNLNLDLYMPWALERLLFGDTLDIRDMWSAFHASNMHDLEGWKFESDGYTRQMCL